jgi:FkbH-like protein
MYETEANGKFAPASELPDLAAWGELKGQLLARTLLSWSEHCTECVWPTCYATCDLFSPREDGRCRRFEEGMVRIDCPSAVNSYVLKITFKKWGKLWSPGTIRLRKPEEAHRIEQRDYLIGRTLFQLPAPEGMRRKIAGKRYIWKKRMAQQLSATSELPSSFLIECFNPEPASISLSLTMRSATSQINPIPFQKLIEVQPGFQRVRVPMCEITRIFDLTSPFQVDLIPNSDTDLTTLYFGLVDFVLEVPVETGPSANGKTDAEAKDRPKKVKCVVWDLDNTLWDGILVEDGVTNLKLKPYIAEMIKMLDRRGILNSIASKNNRDEALQALNNFGLDDYFLYPQISWQPKSEGIKRIAESLNIGLDSVLFVDDTQFELQEVQVACPGVRVLPAGDDRTILQMRECDVPVTAESANRRAMYQVESKRQEEAGSFGTDYLAFLRHCKIRLNIRPMTADNIERVHELTQRTNQMNFSGNRYTREVLKDILADDNLDTFVLDCEDRFGQYGVVGFSIVDSREPRMTDLMFSCRIQAKRVEHAFLSHIIRKYIAESKSDFYANYRKTPRNAPAGRVFADLEMEELGARDGVTSLLFSKDRLVQDDRIIEIVVHEREACNT